MLATEWQENQARFSSRQTVLLAYDLNEGSFAPAPIKLPIKNLLPGTEIEFSFRNGNDYFTAHDLTL